MCGSGSTGYWLVVVVRSEGVTQKMASRSIRRIRSSRSDSLVNVVFVFAVVSAAVVADVVFAVADDVVLSVSFDFVATDDIGLTVLVLFATGFWSPDFPAAAATYWRGPNL